jgi:hypothetical protein
VGLDGPAEKSVESRVFSEKLDLSNALPAESYVGFTAATTADDREIHEILSWEFSSSDSSPAPGIPTIPGASAHRGTTINQGLIIGVSLGATLLLLTIILILLRRTLRKFTYKRITKTPPKLRIFISHTGGDDGQAKNFPISLFEKLNQDPRYKVFIDRQMRKGVDFSAEIKQEAQLIDLGIVVVTKEYFGKKWPMIELVEFVDMYRSGRRSVRVLPLFYMLTPGNVRELVVEGYWEAAWKSMSTEEHPVDVDKWRRVVLQLCLLNGIEYIYRDGSREAEYIRDVLSVVESIFEEVSNGHNSFTQTF